MSGFGRRKGGGRRIDAREPLLVEAALLTLRVSHSVLITDVSQSGAQLQGAVLPDTGDEIWLKVNNLNVLATTAWRVEGAGGVQFDEPLAAEQIIYMRREGRGTTVSKLAMQDWQSGLAR